MSVAAEFEAANQKYAASFAKGDLPLPPGRYLLHSFLSPSPLYSKEWLPNVALRPERLR